MIRIKIQAFFLVVGFIFSYGTEISAQDPRQDYVAAAREFLQAAQNGLNQAQQLCQAVDCGPEFTTQLGNLGEAISRLNELLGKPAYDVDAIRSATGAMALLIQELCNRLGASCTASPAGIDPVSNLPEPSDYTLCRRSVREERTSCIRNVNQWLNCWQRVPYCDWPGWPFDVDAFRRDCQDFITLGLPACRCACPQSERQGGCPTFFQTGRMTECGNCSYESCQRGGDSQCSCSQMARDPSAWNAVQCDLCRWSNAGLAAAEWKRAAVCEKRHTEGIHDCRLSY